METQAAFAAAKDGAFTLVVDCTVFVHVGSDIAKPVFIDNGTSVQFTKDGLFIADNALVPTFVIANSSHIQILDWHVRYIGETPVVLKVNGYYNNGSFVTQPTSGPGPEFTDLTLTNWLSANRGIVFSRVYGKVASRWLGPSNCSSLFFILGSSSEILVKGFKLDVPPGAKAGHFQMMVFSGREGYKSNQTVTTQTPVNSTYLAIPSKCSFIDIDLDGYYTGFQGAFVDSIFRTIRGHRYGDLEDDNGGNLGGVGKWAAPPHLFYLATPYGPVGLGDQNIEVTDVIDYGNRVGSARDLPGEPLSGYITSLKIGGNNIKVSNYTTYRPDGVADILPGENMKFENVQGTYDSSFTHDIYPAGIRFPAYSDHQAYAHVLLQNITLTDKAPETKRVPILGSYEAASEDIVMKNVKINMSKYTGNAPVKPVFSGNHSPFDVVINQSASGAKAP